MEDHGEMAAPAVVSRQRGPAIPGATADATALSLHPAQREALRILREYGGRIPKRKWYWETCCLKWVPIRDLQTQGRIRMTKRHVIGELKFPGSCGILP